MNTRYTLRLASVVACAALSYSSIARAGDTGPLVKAPAAVQSVVKKMMGDGKLNGLDSEMMDGKTVYEADLSIKGGAYVLVLADDGTVIQREVAVDAAMIPPTVLDAAAKAHPDAKLNEAAIITRGTRMFYELEFMIGTVEHAMEITADGNVTADAAVKP